MSEKQLTPKFIKSLSVNPKTVRSRRYYYSCLRAKLMAQRSAKAKGLGAKMIRASNLSAEERQKMADEYLSGETVYAVGRRHGFGGDFVRKEILKIGIVLRPPLSHKLSRDRKLLLIEDYMGGLNSKECGIKYNLDSSSAWAILRRRCMSRNTSDARREYSVDQHAFDMLTSDSAYWAGMLITDGCICDESSLRLLLSLKRTDEGHLIKLKEFLKSNHPIHYGKPSTSGAKGQAILSIRSSRLCGSLVQYGVFPRKTHIAKAPDRLSRNPHFWRGCVDGDGTVMLAKSKRSTLGFTPVVILCGASLSLIEQFSSFANSVCETSRTKIQFGRGVYSFRVCGRRAIELVYSMYGLGGTSLDRKQQTADRIISISTSDPLWCRRLSRKIYLHGFTI